MPHWTELLGSSASSGGYLRWKEVAKRTSLSRTTAWRLQRRGEFPRPYAISPGRVGYREDEVEAWRLSRDRRGARGGSHPAVGSGLDAAPAGSTTPVGETSPPRRQAKIKAEQTAGPVSVPSVTAPLPIEAPAVPSAAQAPRPANLQASSRSGRRRSQHAQAIAQQILFDF